VTGIGTVTEIHKNNLKVFRGRQILSKVSTGVHTVTETGSVTGYDIVTEIHKDTPEVFRGRQILRKVSKGIQ